MAKMDNKLGIGIVVVAIVAMAVFAGCVEQEAPLPLPTSTPTPSPTGVTPVYGYKIVNTYPHDRNAFTQGVSL